MRDLGSFFENPFKHRSFGLAKFLAFSTDHLQRMIANNPGAELNSAIVATTAALGTMVQCASDDGLRLMLRQAAKQAKDTFRAGLPANVGKIYGKVIGHYGVNAPQVTTVFGQGRGYYTEAPDDVMTARLTVLFDALTPLAAAMGPAARDDAGGLLSTWIALYAASEQATGTKVATEQQKAAAWDVLELQIVKNLADLAGLFPGQKPMAVVYFRQDLLENPATPVPAAPGLTAVPGAAPLSVDITATLPPEATGWNVYAQGPGDPAMVLVSSLAAAETTTTITFSTATSGDVYAITLKATNAGGESDPSPTTEVTLP